VTKDNKMAFKEVELHKTKAEVDKKDEIDKLPNKCKLMISWNTLLQTKTTIKVTTIFCLGPIWTLISMNQFQANNEEEG
jgi:hypothetical protein